MAKVTFRIKSKKADENATIYVRFQKSANENPELKTEISTKPCNWNPEKQLIIGKDDLKDEKNNALKSLDVFINRKYLSDFYDDSQTVKFDSNWLRQTMDKHTNQKTKNENHFIYLIDYLNFWKLKNTDTSRRSINSEEYVKLNTIENYYNAIEITLKSELHQNKKIKTKLSDIDLIWLEKWKDYVNNYIANSTAISYLTYIKTILKEANHYKIYVNPMINDNKFKVHKSKKELPVEVYLDEAMIKKVYLLENLPEKYLHTRDYFIIGCCTALRGNDFLQRCDISNINQNSTSIRVLTAKKDRWVTIPLHPYFKDILRQNNWQFPKSETLSGFDRKVKEICQIAGFDTMTEASKTCGIKDKNGKPIIKNKRGVRKLALKEFPFYKLVASHTCRRSFATNFYQAKDKQGNVMITDQNLLDICGWKDISMITKYVKNYKDNEIAGAYKYMEDNFAQDVIEKYKHLKVV